MLKRYFLRFCGALLALAALTSCGDSKAEGTADLATVTVTASGSTGPLDSDVATWVDATTGAAATACGASVPTTTPDSVDYTIASTPFTSAGTTTSVVASPIRINRIKLTLNPANSFSPALPAIFQTQFPSSSFPIILPGSSATVPVRIVTNQLKDFFRNSLGALSITCASNPTYSYLAEVSFEIHEVNTDRVSTTTAPGKLLVNFTDYIDD